jgi:hypothetical protein
MQVPVLLRNQSKSFKQLKHPTALVVGLNAQLLQP